MSVKHKLPMGQNGLYVYEGIGAFVTTGTTVELAIPFERIHSYALQYVGAPAVADGPLSINETVATDPATGKKTIKRDASGNVTIQRVAGMTSAVGFTYQIWGK